MMTNEQRLSMLHKEYENALRSVTNRIFALCFEFILMIGILLLMIFVSWGFAVLLALALFAMYIQSLFISAGIGDAIVALGVVNEFIAEQTYIRRDYIINKEDM